MRRAAFVFFVKGNQVPGGSHDVPGRIRFR